MSKQAQKFWGMTKNKATNSAEISIYGTIGSSWWDESISASQFAKDLKELGDDLDQITVRINSAGGSVFDGLAIRSQLRNHKATITVHVDGWAASIASIIAMAGDKIHMASGSMMMIHNPMNSVWGGQAKDFREMADVLDKIRDSLVNVYAGKTGIDRDELVALMDAETWMTAEEAVEKGFADEVEGGTAVAASMMGAVAMVNGVEMDYSRFKRIPTMPHAAAAQPNVPASTPPAPSAQPENKTQEEEDKPMNMDELKAKHPELFAQVLNQGVTQERERVKGIQALAGAPGAAEIVAKAISEGMEAGQAAMEYVKAQAAMRHDEGTRRAEDSAASNAARVPVGDPLGDNPSDDAKAEAEAAAIAEFFTKKGGK
ncbi:hypothetical protein YDYSY3_57800 [Paenibacillus chitinolyticus]|uniref:head maturation protease, ClpP-related n=1 Tax=Paenibacillus chitinolyticus TaxID=79263 RepID=UPI0026E4C38C|nr:head maturation protease, ClpP-related [Paenibacillus chitinolyticus]GKS14780.1 hypothetical protein YDYSY3_57800 [Paenibacillus chitinolyticus]